MALQHEPESLDVMRARYAEAVRVVFDPADVNQPAPGHDRANVFDFDDGVRMVIARSVSYVRGGERVYFSASVRTGTLLALSIDTGGCPFNVFADLIVGRWREIAQSDAVVRFIGLSGGGHQIPVWVVISDQAVTA